MRELNFDSTASNLDFQIKFYLLLETFYSSLLMITLTSFSFSYAMPFLAIKVDVLLG